MKKPSKAFHPKKTEPKNCVIGFRTSESTKKRLGQIVKHFKRQSDATVTRTSLFEQWVEWVYEDISA